jgi:pyridoxine 4-dehydrogenase
MRSHMPRFLGENFEKNLDLVRKLQDFAKKKGCTPAQLALSWVRHLSRKEGNPEIIPIPGATKVDRILENAKDYPLNSEESATIDSILKDFEVAGARYGGPQAAHMEG